MGANDKNLEIIKKVFGGDAGKEQQLQNDAIMMLMLKQEAIIASMAEEQLLTYGTALNETGLYDETIRIAALDMYAKIKPYRTIVEEVIEEEIIDE